MPNHFSQSIKSLLSDGMKAITRGLFSAGGGSSSSGYNYYNNSGISRQFGYTPGSAIRWDLITGDLMANPIAACCLNIIQDNFCQARIRVEAKGEEEDKYEPIPEHPLLPLLKQPNPYYSFDYLIRGVIASMHGQGDAYIGIERDGNGLPAELYWVPYGLAPRKDKGSNKLFDGYLYKQGNRETKVDTADVIHIAMGCDPARPGFGMSVAQVLKQAQYILQQSDNYTANIMRNNGAIGALLTPKNMKEKGANDQELEAQVDAKLLTDLWKSKTQGDRVGEPLYLDFPIDVNFPKNSPHDLSLADLPDRYEATICAAMRVSILLVGAHGGRHAKTYANLKEARQALWEENLLPLQAIIAAELTTQLLPQLGGDAVNERVAFDTSGIRALQPDLDELHRRVRDDWQANGIDLYTYMQETKRVPEEWQQGIYHWMLPTISDRATSVDSLIPPGGRQEATLPSTAPTIAQITPDNGANVKPLTVAANAPALPQFPKPLAVAKNGNGKH